jgi:hypothetical protein
MNEREYQVSRKEVMASKIVAHRIVSESSDTDVQSFQRGE